jgi:hypothetical protein
MDWPRQPDETHPLTELLLADYQVVDFAKPHAEDSYLESSGHYCRAGRTRPVVVGR